MSNYRLLEHKEEIFKMVKKAPVIEIGEVWQTLPFSREVFRIQKLDVLDEAMVFVTTFPFEFDPQFPIYIKLNYKNLVFKLSAGEYRASNNQLSCGYPKEAKVIEDRSKSRRKLPRKTSLHITLRSLAQVPPIDIKVSVADISEWGLGIRTSAANKELFSKNANFIIMKVCGREHYEQTVLTVRHVSSAEDSGYLGIGLLGSHPFGEKIFEMLEEESKCVKFRELKGSESF